MENDHHHKRRHFSMQIETMATDALAPLAYSVSEACRVSSIGGPISIA